VAILYCKLAQKQFTPYHLIFQSYKTENTCILEEIRGERKKQREKQTDRKRKKKESVSITLSLSLRQICREKDRDWKQKEERKTIFFSLNSIQRNGNRKHLQQHWGRSRIGRLWEHRQRSNLVMSNVESSGDRVFEEVKFCEPSSQQRIR
jgi:hypothetical protein